MGRIYTAAFSGQAETVAVDLLEILAPADAIVVIHEMGCGQTLDVGDAEEEILLLTLKSGGTAGSGGQSSTEVPLLVGDPASGVLVEDTNTSQSTGGVLHYTWAWNVRMQWQQIWTPETRPILAPSRRLILAMSAPGDSLTLNGYVVYEEIG